MGKRSWWSVSIGGLAAVAAGLFFVFSPARTLTALVTIFGLFAVVAGIFTLVAGLRAQEAKSRRIQILEGVLGLVAGLVLLFRPEVGGRVLLWVVGLWACVIGVIELVQGVLAKKANPTAWMLAAAGAFTFIFGIALLVGRSTSVAAISWLVGLYLLAWGCVRTAYGASLRSPLARQAQAA